MGKLEFMTEFGEYWGGLGKISSEAVTVVPEVSQIQWSSQAQMITENIF